MSDQFISQSKEINQELKNVINNEANNLYALYSNLNDEITKSCCNQRQQPNPPFVPPVSKPVPVPAPKVSPQVINRQAPPPQQPVFEYVQELKLLNEMGFNNETRNRSLLTQFKGDVNQCINALII